MTELSAFTIFDALVLGVIAFSALAGFRRGFVTEILSLAAWGGAIVITVYGLQPLTETIRETVQPDVVADVIAFAALFIGGLFLLKLLASWIGESVRSSFVGPLDRAAGTAFGVLRGALIVSFVYLLYSHWVPEKDQPDSVRDAQTRPLVEYGAEMLAVLGPELLEDAREADETEAILERMKENMPTSTFVDDSGYEEKMRQEMKKAIEEMAVDRDKKTDEKKDDPDSKS